VQLPLTAFVASSLSALDRDDVTVHRVRAEWTARLQVESIEVGGTRADAHSQAPASVRMASTNSSGDYSSLRVDVDEESTHSGEHPPVGTNIFIAGIPIAWDQATLAQHLEAYGVVTSLRLVPERRFAFAQFRDPHSAIECMKALHNTRVGPEPGASTLHVAESMHSEAADVGPNPRLFIRGLPSFACDRTLQDLVGPFGETAEASVIVHANGRCKGTGFVTFLRLADAARCLDSLDGSSRFFQSVPPSAVDLAPQPVETATCTLTVKYSETQQLRAERVRKNKERIAGRAAQGQSPSSRGRGGGLPSSSRSQAPHPLTAPQSLVGHGGSALSSPHPPNAAVAFGSLLAPQAVAMTPDGARDIFGLHHMPHAGAMMAPFQPPSPSHNAGTLVLRSHTPAFPRCNDLFIGPIAAVKSAEAAVGLINEIAEPPSIVAPFTARDGTLGFAVRLRNIVHTAAVVQALNGAAYLSGQRVVCWRFA
jgi:RNA recognition motif-containing protein